MPDPNHIRQVLERYPELLTKGDVDAIVALYHPDASLEDPIGSELLRGHDAIRGFYEASAGTERRKIDTSYAWAWFLLILVIFFVAIPVLWEKFGSPNRVTRYHDKHSDGGGNSSGGGFGGGGGFSGGGGGFGGGGASGGW